MGNWFWFMMVSLDGFFEGSSHDPAKPPWVGQLLPYLTFEEATATPASHNR